MFINTKGFTPKLQLNRALALHEDSVPYSNVPIYEQIVKENYASMVAEIDDSRTPKEDGSGYIIKYDPTHSSFKKAMIVVTFSGMWLEAIFHQYMVKNHSKNQFTKYNQAPYKEKLKLIGISDAGILDSTDKLQKTRNELIHEKAFMDKGEIKLAQKEAKEAFKIIEHVSNTIKV